MRITLGAAFSAITTGWYHRRFGFARPRRDRLVRADVGAAIVVVVVLVAFVLDRWLVPPVALSLLAVAAGLDVGQFLMLRRVGLTPVHRAVCAALVVVGLVDHRRPVRAMGPAAGVEEDPTR